MKLFKPPKLARKFLLWHCDPDLLEEIEGDLNEEFEIISKRDGYRKGRLFYAFETIRFVRMYKPKKRIKSLNTMDMLLNYFKLAFRNLRKHKAFSLINILGLSVGLACCVLIGLYISEELNYDRFHAKADRTYRVTRLFKSSDGGAGLHLSRVAPPFATYMKEDFDQIESIARFVNYGGMVKYEDKIFNETSFLWADPEIVDILSFEVIAGEIRNGLGMPNSVVISESASAKYFGGEDPIGKTINYDNEVDLMVRGVFEDFPQTSSFQFDLVGNMNYVISSFGGSQEVIKMWYRNQFATLFILKNNADLPQVEGGLNDFLTRHLGEDATDGNELQIQKLTDIHLHSNLADEQGRNSDIAYIFIFAAIALLILVIACINYMNLATAKASNRAKEVGMRKVFGAAKGNLVYQFLVESVLLVLISVFIAAGISLLTLPAFRSFTGLELDLGRLLTGATILKILAFSLLIGILAGSYPAFYLTKFRILKVLKGKVSAGSRNASLRKILVVFQFTISIILVVSTIVVFQQLNFIQNKSLGYDKDQMMIISSNSELQQNYNAFKGELTKLAGVRSVGGSIFIPSSQLLNSQGSAEIEVNGELKSTGVGLKDLSVDHDFLTTYDMEILQGRNFSREFETDTANFILNQTAVKRIGWDDAEDAVGQFITYGGVRGQVIGVLKDFHFESLQSEIQPVILTLNTRRNGALSVKVEAGNIASTIDQIEDIYSGFAPNFPIRFNFLDERFETLYQTESQRSELFTVFSGLAIFLACLGLFGLTSFTVIQRSKEISIRKVLGASVNQIVGILSKEFVMLVVVSMVLAFPLAWYFMGDWLAGYAYRIDLTWVPFIAAAIVAGMIAFLTISIQTFKAAVSNPSDSLRDD